MTAADCQDGTTRNRETFRRRLPEHFSLVDAAEVLQKRGNLIWFDSSSRGPQRGDGHGVGRWSFLSADPIDRFVRSIEDENPWDALDRWLAGLTMSLADRSNHPDPTLPPFCGGWAGSIGYEAGSHLEPTGVAAQPGLADSIIDIGCYDWVLCTDHHAGHTELIVPGWALDKRPGRADEVFGWIADVIKQPIAPEPPSTESDESLSQTESNFSVGEFQSAVAQIVRRICRGDSFQVNLAQTLWCQTRLDPMRLYRRLRRRNPAPMSAYYDASTYQVLCSSPEGFLRVDDRVVETRPIKGTVKRTGDDDIDRQLADQLLRSEKDRAENVMIVDLMRNDLSRVCVADSIEVPVLCQIERYQFVQHLVSVVTGTLKPESGIIDLLRASFPGGSITGAPKIEAMRTIAQLEPHQRGPYCGSLGYVDLSSGDCQWNICIRTMIHRDGRLQIPVGGGMTARSDPANEEAETWIKAEGMLRALSANF